MNIYEGKAILGNLPEAPEELVGKTTGEVLLFTPNDKPLMKNINIINTEEEQQEFFDNLPSGTMIHGELHPPELGEEEYWEVSANNTKIDGQLQQIELPTVVLEDIVFIPQKMVAGDMPVILNESYADKIQYEYEEALELE